VVHGCHSMPIFERPLAESLTLISKSVWNRSHDISGHETISAASSSRPLNILHMGLMSDADMMLQSSAGSWWMGARPCQFLNGGWLKV
jgi:hypothetical protein